MNVRLRAVWCLAACLGASSCVVQLEPLDGGEGSDAGEVADGGDVHDAGDARDAGDGGDVRDGGSDAGAMDAGGIDASVTRYDGGPPRDLDAGLPTWLVGKQPLEWFQIAGTSGAGGSKVYAYSGMAFKNDTSEIIIALAGGHGDSADNRVVSLRLDEDAPKWVTRLGPSATVAADVAYYADGRPSARHTYYTTNYIPQLSRLMVIGAQFTYGSAHTFTTVDGFDLETNTWDPQGTWPDTVGGFGKSVDPGTGDVWTTNGLSVLKWSASTHQQVQLMSFNNTYMAMQSSYDPVRGQLVSIGFGDGWGYGNRDELHAFLVNSMGSLTPLTFTPSPALTQFMADRPVSCALEYDPDLERYYVFDNEGDGPNGPADDGGRIYVITPNATATWDIAILPLGTGTLNPPKGPGTGVWNRLRYVPRLKGLVYLAAPNWNSAPDLYFIRTQ